MNTTSNTTEKNNAQPVFNYAQAVKKSSQNSESQGAENNDASSVANETKPSEVKNVKVDELSSVSEASKDEQSNEVKSEPLANKIDSAQLPSDLEKNNEDSKSSIEENLTNTDNTSTPHKSNASELEHNPSSSHSNPEKHNSSNDQSGYHKKPMSPNNTGNWQGNQYYRHSQYYGRNSYSADKPSYNSPTFVPQLSVNKAIPIINPDTSEVINLSARSSSTNSPSNPSKTEEHKDVKVASTPSRAIKIVNPNEKEEEAEQKAKEEAEQKAKEEAEQKAKEEAEQKAKEEAEQKAKEEAEQKAKEEAEQKEKEEAEQKAKEEAEQKEKEEAEQKEKEEAEQKAKEEAEQKEKEEAEQKAKEEAEQKEKEEAEQKAKEEAEMKPTEQTAEKETDEKHEAEVKDNESKIGNEEERIAAITADKIARGAPPGRLDMSAIPAHVFHDSPVSTPTSIVPPKVKRSPLPVIEDFSAIEYPADIVAPTGKDSVTGRISYKRAFLLQFQKLCTETDEDLSQIPAASEESSSNENRRGMSRRQTSERGRGPRTPGGSGDNMFRNNSRDGRGEMGKFSGGRSLSHRQGSNGMERQGSQGGRNRSNRGGKSRHPSKEQVGAPTLPPEQVVPLTKSANRWVPAVIATSGTASTTSEAEAPAEAELISQEMIARKVKALLNKLTIERFDSISDQIWEYAKQSEKEDNGQSLRTVIQLVFDKACDEPNFAGMWAQLCKKMYDVISQNTDIKDVNILDKNNEPVSSGPLYRKYLLNRCQQEFEKGWKSNLPKMDENSSNEMLTDEYYAAAKAKRQGLGLVQFVGELYRRQMLSDRVMIECLMRLCSDPQQPEDDETETMCKLLTTIGQTFEVSSRKNKEWLDTYFERMKEMYKSPILSSRIKFKILDVFDLRKSKWTLKRGNQPAPATIAEIHEQAKKASEEKESMKRSSSSRGTASHPVSRQGSHRGGGRPL